MSWIVASGWGRTHVYGGPGGNWFDQNLGQEFIKNLRVVYCEDYVYSVQITATDGELYTHGRSDRSGAETATFRFDFEGSERIKQMEFYAFRKVLSSGEEFGRFGGVAITTNKQTAKIGPLRGEKFEVGFEQNDAKLNGFCGRDGWDVDAFGLYFCTDRRAAMTKRCLPEGRWRWVSPHCSRETPHLLAKPFKEITKIELSVQKGNVVGICAEFEDGATRLVGACKDDPDSIIELPKNKLITEASFHQNSYGYLSALSFAHGIAEEPEGWLKTNSKTEKIHKATDVNARLLAIKCSLNEAGAVDTLRLLFSQPCKVTPLGCLPSLDASNEERAIYLEETKLSHRLSNMTTFSNNGIVRGISWTFKDGTLVSCGETDGHPAAIQFSDKAQKRRIKVERTSEDNIVGIKLNESGLGWTGDAEINADKVIEAEVLGNLIGVFAKNVGNVVKLGLVSYPPGKVTPACGDSNALNFFETDCIYAANDSFKEERVISIAGWLDKKQSTLNGLEVQKHVPGGYGLKTFNIGTQNGVYSKITLHQTDTISKIEVALSSCGSRICGIRIVSNDTSGRTQLHILGGMDRNVHSTGLQTNKKLLGVYGTCHEDMPSSIGFVVEDA